MLDQALPEAPFTRTLLFKQLVLNFSSFESFIMIKGTIPEEDITLVNIYPIREHQNI